MGVVEDPNCGTVSAAGSAVKSAVESVVYLSVFMLRRYKRQEIAEIEATRISSAECIFPSHVH